jgi:type I restriction enzyme S subunit
MASDWRQYTLWDLAEYINGRATKPSEVCSEGVPVIKIAELNRGITDKTDRVPPDLVEEKHWVKPGDLLFAWSGSVGIYKYNGPPAALNQHIFRVVARPYCDQGFLRYLLLSCLPTFVRHVEDKKTTMGHVTLRDLQRITVRIPPLPEQCAIAHILGTLDDKIELNRRMSETLEQMARALFKAWFVDFEPVRAKCRGDHDGRPRWQRGQSLPGLPAHLYDLFPDRLVDSELGEIPEGWGVKTLGECAVNFDSKRVPLSSREREKRPGEYPYYGAAGVMDHIDDYLFDGVYVLLGEDGSVMTESGCAVVQYVWGKFWVNNHAHVLQGKGAISTEQLYLYFHFETVAPYVTGAVQPKLSQGRMNSMPFIFAGDRVCHAFAEVVEPLFAQVRTITDESRTLAALRDALLPKLISGEIRVKDAERFLEERGL